MIEKSEVTLIDPPSSIRGTVIRMLTLKGKQKRIAHAYLLPNGTVDKVTVELPRSLTTADLREVAKALVEFADVADAA